MVAPPPAPGGERQGSSRALHGRWVRPAATPAAFDALLRRAQDDTFVALVARRLDDGAIVGYANVSQIIRGPLQSFLGYGGVVGQAGQGYLTEAIGLVLRRAFTELRLRLEANVQPGNVASVALVRRCGFEYEGFSPRYRKVGGRWCDHERRAIRAEQWRTRGG